MSLVDEVIVDKWIELESEGEYIIVCVFFVNILY